jgi:sec-independent protein translocase protein TatB
MLDFSWGELMMIGVVALVVLGPERLPRVARAFGQMVSKAQRYASQTFAELRREVELADLKRLQQEAQSAVASIDSSMRQVTGSIDSSVREAAASLEQVPSLDDVVATGSAAPEEASAWESGSDWGSHRFRTRARPSPSLTDLAEVVERMRGRTSIAPLGRIGRNRYAPRARVNRPRIYR